MNATLSWNEKKRHFINRFLIVNYIEVFLQIIDRVNPRHTSNIFGILSADRCALSRQIIKLQTINQFLLIAETLILKLKRWRSTTALIITVKKKQVKEANLMLLCRRRSNAPQSFPPAVCNQFVLVKISGAREAHQLWILFLIEWWSPQEATGNLKIKAHFNITVRHLSGFPEIQFIFNTRYSFRW